MSECEKDDKGLWKLNATSVNVYASLIRLRNQELATHWTRYHVFAALNSAVLVAFANFSGHRVGNNILLVLGFLLTILWFLFTYYGKEQLIERWDEALVVFEKEVAEECGFKAFISKWHNQKGFIHYLQLLVPVIFLLIWVGVHMHWHPDTDRRIKAEESISKSIDDLKQEMMLFHKSVDSQEEAIRQLQATLAAQASSGAIRNK